VSNVLSKLALSSRTVGERLERAIVNDGEGFDARREHPDHLGLRTMQERTQAIAGTLEVQSEPGSGTTVRLVIG
jgi:signal transduction histidine kinase